MGRYEKRGSVSKMIEELGWDSLEARRKKKRLSVFYKSFVGNSTFLEISVRIKEAEYLGRHDHKCKVRCILQRIDSIKFCFLKKTIEEWNGLLAEVFGPFPKDVKFFVKCLGKFNKLTRSERSRGSPGRVMYGEGRYNSREGYEFRKIL